MTGVFDSPFDVRDLKMAGPRILAAACASTKSCKPAFHRIGFKNRFGILSLSRISFCIRLSREPLPLSPLATSITIFAAGLSGRGVEVNRAVLQLEHAVDLVEHGVQRKVDIGLRRIQVKRAFGQRRARQAEQGSHFFMGHENQLLTADVECQQLAENGRPQPSAQRGTAQPRTGPAIA